MTPGGRLCSPVRGATRRRGGGTEDAGVGGAGPGAHTRRRERGGPHPGTWRSEHKAGVPDEGQLCPSTPGPGTRSGDSLVVTPREGRRHPVGRGGVTNRPHGPACSQHPRAALTARDRQGAWRGATSRLARRGLRPPCRSSTGQPQAPCSLCVYTHTHHTHPHTPHTHRPPAACVYTHTHVHAHRHTQPACAHTHTHI